MKRAFLILLVLYLILVSAAVQHAAYATPFGDGKFLGLVPYYNLRNALPAGVFVAGELLVAVGMGAQLLLTAGRVSGRPFPHGRHGEQHLLQLQACALWCGWTTVACCTLALPNIFPHLLEDNALFQVEDYQNFTMAGAGVSLFCYMLNFYLRGKGSLVPGLLTLALCVCCGSLWCKVWWLMPILVIVCTVAALTYNMEGKSKGARAVVAGMSTYAAVKLSITPFPAEPLSFRLGMLLSIFVVLCCLVSLSTLRFIRPQEPGE